MPSSLQIRPLSEMDAAAYHVLRTRSLDGLVFPPEAEVMREIQAGAEGMAALLAAYPGEETLVWGGFDAETLAGAMAVSRRSLGWPHKADHHALRRLQVAADTGAALGFAIRDRRHAEQASPAALRLEIQVDRQVRIRKCRGGNPPPRAFALRQ